MLFSGDLGPEEKAFHPEPDAPTGYDYIICESTYGNRDREDYTLEKRREAMRDELRRGLSRGGNVVIPSFAVERSQELLHDIAVLLDAGEIPNATVYLDSPLARKATEVFIKYASEMEDIEVDESKIFRHPNFRLVESVEESIAINHVKKGAIIISASGMCTAGTDQAPLEEQYLSTGVDDSVRRLPGSRYAGQHHHQRRQAAFAFTERNTRCEPRYETLGNYSAHADQVELINWILERGPILGGLFLNHGEDDARTALADLLATKGIDRENFSANL